MNLGLTVALLVTPIMAASTTWRTPLNLFAGLTVVVALFFFAVTRGQTLQASSDLHTAIPNSDRAVGTYSIRNVPLVLICIGYFMMLFHTYGMITWLPEYLKVAKGYSPTQVGTVSMLLGLVMIPGTFVSGWLGDRIGAWGIGMIGVVLCGACPAAFVLVPGIPLWGILAGVCFLAFGICLFVVPLTSILSYLVPVKDNGKAVGLVHTTGYAGSIASTYLGGYLLTLTGSYSRPFVLYVGSMVISLFVLLAMHRYYIEAETVRHIPAIEANPA
jgi:predicted MFS family arabinose efflux permease